MPTYAPDRLQSLLTASPAMLTRGLRGQEIADLEARFGFTFGPDHRELLRLATPVGEGWPDWRQGSDGALQALLDLPVRRILSDVEHKAFWPRSWGDRPPGRDLPLAVARQRLSTVPRLVPLYRDRYLPAAPIHERAAVISFARPEVSFAGFDLEDFLRREFGPRHPGPLLRRPKPIPFWSELAEGREAEL